MKNHLKKILALSLLTTTMISLGACSKRGNEFDSHGNVIVTMSLINSTNENPGWLALIDAANKKLEDDGQKVRIEPEIIKTDSWDDYYTKVNSNMLGRVGGTIGRIAESHIPQMISKNQIQDLTSIRNKLIETGAYNAEAFEGVAKKDGKYYGLPSGTQHMVLYYNKTIFDNYNRDHPDDTISYPSGDWTNASTFEEIKATAKKLSSGSGATRKFGLSAGPFLAYAGMYAVNSGGENIFDSQGNCVIKSQPFYDVYQWFDEMLKVDKSMPTTSDTATSSAFDRFLTGNIAMMVDGVWQLHDIVEYTEDFEIGVAAIPVKSSQYVSHSTTFTDRFFATRTSPHPEEDKIALEYLLSAEAINAVSSKQVGGFPIRTESIDNYLSALSDTKLKAYVEVIKGGINHSVNVPYSTYYNIVDQRINQKMSTWINGDITSVQFVDFMDETMKLGMEGKL